MRLLELEPSGGFSLTEFHGDGIPQYAILSHTWIHGEEFTFNDLMTGTGKDKSGYAKIQFCRDQAEKDELKYFWVDTCCIDKSSSAELTTAINSMFRWYQDAAKCYVYLSDVKFKEIPWEAGFRRSRWFSRGWTLQELLAPAKVEFFSSDRERLGDKKSLEREIHDITGIAIEALRGKELSEFSITERLGWAANRKTTVEEDEAYCLLGIFNIYMPLIYGEGRNAYIRLRRKLDKSSKRTHEEAFEEEEAPLGMWNRFKAAKKSLATYTHRSLTDYEQLPRCFHSQEMNTLWSARPSLQSFTQCFLSQRAISGLQYAV